MTLSDKTVEVTNYLMKLVPDIDKQIATLKIRIFLADKSDCIEYCRFLNYLEIRKTFIRAAVRLIYFTDKQGISDFKPICESILDILKNSEKLEEFFEPSYLARVGLDSEINETALYHRLSAFLEYYEEN